MAYTEEGLKESYQELKSRLNRDPSKNDFESDSVTPSTSTVIRFFGKWSDFVIACGDIPKVNAKGSDAVQHNKKTVRFTDDVINIIGGRNKSRLINNLLLRIASVSDLTSITDEDIKTAKEILNKNSEYHEQGFLVREFAKRTGRTVASSIIILELIERDL